MRCASAVVGLFALAGCVLNPAFDPELETEGGSGSGSGPDATTTEGTGEASMDASSGGGPAPQLPGCAPFPAPAGNVRTLTAGESLAGALSSAVEGDTLVLEPGEYPIDSTIWVGAAGLTVRSSTGMASDVVLSVAAGGFDGIVVNAPDFAIAEVTLQGGDAHQLVVSGSDLAADDAVIYGVRFIDPAWAAIRANTGVDGTGADRGVVACSEFLLRDEARASENCENGGIAGYGVWDWVVRDSTFEGFWCPLGFAGTAVSFSEGAANTRVERNVIRECVQGVVLGRHSEFEPSRPNPPCGAGPYFDHVGGTARNNVVISVSEAMAASEESLDTGLGLWNVCGAKMLHNTVMTAVPAFSSIEYRYENMQATVANNLVTHEILDRDDAGGPSAENLVVDLSVFASPLEGDFHLLPGTEAIDAGTQLGDDAVDHDIDGDERDSSPDVGADEF